MIEISRVIQISIIGRVSGNVNADEVVGQRITLKKMYSSKGEVLPFVSARAIKRAIREALKERGFKIDPFISGRAGALELSDSGDPVEYIDNDIFGFMYTIGRGAISRQAPIALSYFKALKDTPIKSEFAARFPRPESPTTSPGPFEIEVADFIGKINSIIYDYIGVFTDEKRTILKLLEEEKKGKRKDKKVEETLNQLLQNLPDELDDDVKRERLKAFLEIFLTPTYVLPRRTNSLNIPEYIGGLIALSKKGPIPIFQFHNYDFENDVVDVNALNKIAEFLPQYDKSDISLYYVNYKGMELQMPDYIKARPLDEVIEEAADFLVSEKQ